MIKEKENIDSHCFEDLKKELEHYFEGFESVKTRVILRENKENQIEEKISICFYDDFTIHIKKGEEKNEIVLSGLISCFEKDEELVDIVMSTVFCFIQNSLLGFPQFKLLIRKFEIGFDGYVQFTNPQKEIKNFEKYGFREITGNKNSSVIEMKLDYSIINFSDLIPYGDSSFEDEHFL
jgi:hypothetical protein